MLKRLASLNTTLLGLALLLASVALIVSGLAQPTSALAPAFSVLIVNLGCAILVADKIRSHPALLIFHAALLLILILSVASRLTYLKGWLMLSEGERFEALSGILHQGPLHQSLKGDMGLVQGPFVIRFSEHQGRQRRGKTSSDVWLTDSQPPRPAQIEDQQGLYRQGYYLTISKHYGYAPLLRWHYQGTTHDGLIKLPSLPFNDTAQAIDWQPPDSAQQLWTQLQYQGTTIRDGRFSLPEQHELIVRMGEQRHTLSPGQTVDIAGGRLSYIELRQWIGYEVFYDWTIPWLLSSCLLAVFSLSWFLYQKNRNKPWLLPDSTDSEDSKHG